MIGTADRRHRMNADEVETCVRRLTGCALRIHRQEEIVEELRARGWDVTKAARLLAQYCALTAEYRKRLGRLLAPPPPGVALRAIRRLLNAFNSR